VDSDVENGTPMARVVCRFREESGEGFELMRASGEKLEEDSTDIF
jgi:hypothetical protein